MKRGEFYVGTLDADPDGYLRGERSRSEPVPGELRRDLNEAYSQLSWHGSIYCLALDTHGDLAGLTTSPGLPFKIPGRVGDTPILGGGLYLDNEVGACVSTGTGEINLLNGSSFTVVDNLRRGMGIKDACVDACKQIKKTLCGIDASLMPADASIRVSHSTA